jgi:hypothetical protein
MGFSEFLFQLFVSPIWDRRSGEIVAGSRLFACVQYAARFALFWTIAAAALCVVYFSCTFAVTRFCKYVLSKDLVIVPIYSSHVGAFALTLLSGLFSRVCCNIDVNDIMDILDTPTGDADGDGSMNEEEEKEEEVIIDADIDGISDRVEKKKNI